MQQLPPSFWPIVYRLAGGGEWPPSTADDAALLMRRVIPEGLVSLLMAEASLPESLVLALRDFQALDRANRIRSEAFASAIRNVIDWLEGEPVVILKGSDYAYRFYAAPHLRPRQDIDVLVKREHVAAIADRLLAAGCKRHFPAGAVARVAAYHELVFEVGNTTVEVHHSFIQRTRNRVDYEGVWKRVKPWTGFDRRALQLDDADTLLYHSINMAADQFSSPIFRHLDLWLMLRGRDDILPIAVERAKEWATARALYGALRQGIRYFPDLRRPAMEQATEALLSSRTRRFLDQHVLPDPWSVKRFGRTGQLWRKFHLIDDAPHRAWFAAYHAYAVVAGKILELKDS